LGYHERQRALTGEEHAFHVHAHHPVPRFLRSFGWPARRRDADVVVEHVESAEGLYHGVRRVADLVEIGDIRLDRDCVAGAGQLI